MKTLQKVPKTPDVGATLFFGESLVASKLLTRKKLTKALNEQREQGGRLGVVLVKLKMLTEEQVTGALADHLSTEYVRLDDTDVIDLNVARILPETIAKRFCLVAVGEEDDKIVIAMADPLDVIAMDTIKLKIKREIKIVVSSTQEIRQATDSVDNSRCP